GWVPSVFLVFMGGGFPALVVGCWGRFFAVSGVVLGGVSLIFFVCFLFSFFFLKFTIFLFKFLA
ncbi:hypothetical protein ACQWE9_25165, partial [Salmonella enterica subsp. enterica serovar Infantis]